MMWLNRLLVVSLVCLFPAGVLGGDVSRVTKPSGGTDWQTYDSFNPDDINGDINAIVNVLNGNIDDDNLDVSGITTTSITAGCAGGACSNPLSLADLDDYWATEAEGATNTDPGDSGADVPATTAEGEIARLRYVAKRALIGLNVERENGALVDVDWWEHPVRGPNLIRNGQFGVDSDADGLADNWTLVDGGGGPTASITALTVAEGGGNEQRIQDATGGGDGLEQVVDGLKAATRYLVVARVKQANAADTTNLTITGGLAAGEWDQISTRPITFTGTTAYLVKGGVVITTAVPADLTIQILSTAAADDFYVADVVMFELSEDFIPAPSTFGFHIRDTTKQDAGAGAWANITALVADVMPRGSADIIEVHTSVSFSNLDGGAAAHHGVCVRLHEDGAVVSGPTCTVVPNVAIGAAGNVATLSLSYVNTAATPGTELTYQTQYYSNDADVDITPLHGTYGQLASELSAIVHHR
jgi:hypothetical protein